MKEEGRGGMGCCLLAVVGHSWRGRQVVDLILGAMTPRVGK